jgi:signal transduction histidine kinase
MMSSMASAQAPAGQSQAQVADRPPQDAGSRLRRPLDRAVLGGVCAGIGDRFGIEPLVVRLVAIMTVVVGGIGIALYALAWALIPLAAESEHLRRRQGAWREAALVVLAVIGALVGVHLASAHLGIDMARSQFGAALWPLVLGLCGIALLWRPAGPAESSSRGGPLLRRHMRPRGTIGALRLVAGGLFVAYGSVAVLRALGVQHSLGKAIWAVAIVAIALSVVAGPVFVRLMSSLSFERAARIREQERAEVAAHLHDSVLQTLALIQKRAGDPREVAGLARRQERELRSWLLTRPGENEQDSVAKALAGVAAEVEELHRVPIEVVTVGDGSLHGLEALVQAAREALTNAAKFAGSERVDLYAEVEPERVEVFVRDRGVGFDPQAIPADRRGVRDSIIARMERHGGRATVQSSPGEGTEVELVMTRAAA